MRFGRKRLPHEVPGWVDPHKEVYFITVSCRRRFENQLARAETADRLFETVLHRQERLLWWPHLFLLMPDHWHGLISFPPSGEVSRGFRGVITKWKEWTCKEIGIQWQDDFFEHRLRVRKAEGKRRIIFWRTRFGRDWCGRPKSGGMFISRTAAGRSGVIRVGAWRVGPDGTGILKFRWW